MNKTFYNHTSAVFFPTAVYPDKYRNIKQHRANLEQGYSINNIQALEKIPDHKVNNFSTNYITQPTLLSDITDITSFNTDIQTAITRLSFGQPGQVDQDHVFLYIYNTAGLDPDNGNIITNVTQNKAQRAVGLVSGIEGSFNNNFFFELDIISDQILRVRHTADNGVYYLTWDPVSGRFLFLIEKEADKNQTTTETNNVFRYTIDEQGRLFLLKCYQGKSLIVSNVNGTLSAAVTPSTGLTPGVNNIFNVDLNFEVIQHQQNIDFVSYSTRALNTLTINTDKSLFDQNGQYIFHTEYNDQDINSNQIKFNFFTLDTSRSEYGFIKRGTNMVNADDTTPTFNYRLYNTLDTGLDQEQGNDKMSLTYTFYDKDIFIKNGTTTAFNAPPSIYPFEKLNLNDTTFIKNGALSGPTPGLSDRVYIKRQDSTQYNNGRFLCTWLSAGSFQDPGVWVDRYYYPDVISKREAIYGLDQFTPSFDDSVDTLNRVDDSSTGRNKIRTRKFFDKKSDATITPGILIKYDRLGNQDMEDIITASTPIISSFDSCYTSKPLRITQDNRYLGITENLCKPNDSYGIYKYKSTKFLIDKYKKKNFPITVLRFYQLYGPMQDFNRFIPQLIKASICKEKFSTSKGKQYRDFLHINDAIIAIFKSIKSAKSKGEIFNIGLGKTIQLKKILALVKKKNKYLDPVYGKIKIRRGEKMLLFPSIKKAKKFINWSPKISIEKGINLTNQYYLNLFCGGNL